MMNLPNWKKTPKFKAKGFVDEAKEVFGAIVLEAPEAEMKEMLLKVKLDITYEVKSKSL